MPWLRPFYTEARLLLHALRNGLWRSIAGKGRAVDYGQSMQQWPTQWPSFRDGAAALEYFRGLGLTVREGRNTFYLPPQPKLAEVVGDAVRHYPPGSGFKFLRDSSENAHYLHPDKQTALRRRLIGAPREQLVVANYMHKLGFGPRAWDFCEFRSGAGSLYAFVVEHVDGQPADAAACNKFMETLKRALAETELRITVPNWENKGDFRCPDCNGNLVVDKDGQTRYIDFQNFGVRSTEGLINSTVDEATAHLHFGNQRSYRRQPFLYQSVPGLKRASKRDTSSRFVTIKALLDERGIGFDGRVVLDVGCNAGVMLHHALSSGASWGIGWDLPPVASQARALAAALGFSRIHINAGQMNEQFDFVGTAPEWLRPKLDGSIVFFLAIRGHIGVPDSLVQMPWECLVYEGHQGETLEEIEEHIGPFLQAGAKLVYQQYMRDGDSRPRPFGILIKSGNRSAHAVHATQQTAVGANATD